MKKSAIILVILAFLGACQPEQQTVEPAPRDASAELQLQELLKQIAEQASAETAEKVQAPPKQQPPQVPEIPAEPEPPEEIIPEEPEVQETEPALGSAAEEPAEEESTEQEKEIIAEPEIELAQQAVTKLDAKKPDFYEMYKKLLDTYVDKNGMVDYRTLRRKRNELYKIVKEFDNIHPADYMAWSREEKIAMWINAYNVFTLKLIIDNYPIQPVWYMKIMYPENSIMHILGAWKKKYFNIMGIEYTLNEIEREILLNRFEDPRICFTLSYASMGGAYLRNEPYYPEKLDEQFDEQIKKFLSDNRGLTISKSDRIIYLSDIFNWYEEDFIEAYGKIKKFRQKDDDIRSYLNFIIDYLTEDDVKFLESKDYTVKFVRYDWHLNEQ